MSNDLETTDKEYQWKQDGADGLRSYSYTTSNRDWNYSIRNGTDDNGAYLFSESSTGQPFARRGTLYNWTAATLGSGLDLKTKGDEAQDSICPKGWQLPNYSSNTSFKALVDTYNITSNVAGANRIKEWPMEYLPTGLYDYNYGYVLYRTTYGRWWSSVAVSATNAYFLNSYSDNIDAQGNFSRGYGHALRCVAKTDFICKFLIFCKS